MSEPSAATDRVRGVCLFGGAFDPPHRTHARILEACAAQLPVDRLIVIPSGEHPFKRGQTAPAAARLELCRLAFAGMPGVEVSGYEVEQSGPSYTVETLRHFRQRYPPPTQLFWVIGADNVLALPSWRAPDEIRRLCRLVVVPRRGVAPIDDPQLLWLQFEPDDVSSSEIRAQLRTGGPLTGMLAPAVHRRIAELQLYR